MVGAIGIGWEVTSGIVERHTNAPAVRAGIVDVDFVRWIGRHSATAHHIHLAVEVQPSGFSSGPRYRRNRTNGVRHWIKAKRVIRVYHGPALVIRCTPHVDDPVDAARRRIHNPFGRVGLLGPLGSYPSRGIKLPDLVGGSYVDVEPAQDVELVVSHSETTRENRSHRTGPIVSSQG